ncbi:MAG: hypothetical protein WBP81_05675 [Solirubrobacteraceae bacterium]
MLVIQQREAGRVDPLIEDLAAELLGQPVVDARDLRTMDHRAAWQPGQAILGLLVEQRAQRNHAVTARRRLPARLLTHPQQIVLKHLAREQRRDHHVGGVGGQPVAEAPQVGQVAAHRLRRRVAQQAGTGPALRGLLQPRLLEPLEVDEHFAAVDGRQVAVRQLALAPDVLRPQRLPPPRRAAALDHMQRLGAHAIRSATLSSTPRSASTLRRSSAVGCV